MKRTAFTRFHEELGAKMVPFAGYTMPIEYQGINAEHVRVREQAGVFDVSHMGEIWVKGPNALKFVQYVTTNDASVLQDGKVQYTCFPNGRGGIVDDLLVYRIDELTYLLVVNAANIEKDWNHLCQYAPDFGITPGKELYNASDEICQLAIQGPDAMKIVQKICDEVITDMEYYTFRKCTVAGIRKAILSTTGYTGAGGCEIYVANQDGEKLWNALFEAGKEYGLIPVGLGARDTLRLEMGFCLYGNDIDDTTSPLEAGLGWITKFSESKGDFIDKTFLLEQKSRGVPRKLVGFKMIDRGVPRHGYAVCTSEGTRIGHITSGTMSPMMKIGIGMAYVEPAYSGLDTELFINVRDRLLKAVVVRPPFYKKQ
ncbi:MAG: glycine cleavage system aminomethyltransferase GcvT [Bacteroidales bacterium]|jgi:aminomethyltransferase|nr:glycine cleavage system aminomethyltransferase GcvT [Bacteroidales bacterium]MDD3638817.1 glycine cleavage system aminomethyltransferase GcvT [Bacteroidales bacterium]MDD3943118.1 glycine cleavage system aminomethyltransferase GcvT [Bacteroidales bacterium]MDD4480139.1 glycine cleavage system aminomethyltransferase GcvT [Bacteroidales bacterium]MDD5313667.1 glycine cleavage system aminomethyltransferase GcvT [Bacteroidales bacterium]